MKLSRSENRKIIKIFMRIKLKIAYSRRHKLDWLDWHFQSRSNPEEIFRIDDWIDFLSECIVENNASSRRQILKILLKDLIPIKLEKMEYTRIGGTYVYLKKLTKKAESIF